MASLTNEVIDGVIGALDAAYPNIPVYDEQVEQDMPEPSFSVRSVHPRQSLFLNKRYMRVEMIEVIYHSTPEGRFRNTNEVIESLFSILEYITAGNDTIRGSGMDTHIDDDGQTGVFMVNYKYFVEPVDKGEAPAITQVDLKGVTVQ